MITWLMFESAARTLVLAALVGIVFKLARVRSAPARRIVWQIVLCGALLMPLLCLWSPVSLTTEPTSPVLHGLVSSPMSKLVTLRTSDRMRLQPRRDSAINVWPTDIRTYVAFGYGGVAIVLVMRVLAGLLLALRLKRQSVITTRFENCAVRLSNRISTPVTVGSTVILPVCSTSWDEEKLRIVLAHEACHVRGGDFYWQLITRLHTCLFWFSPLGWWLEKEVSDLNEAVSDEAGRMQAQSRSSYAELLLEFAGKPHHFTASISMARTSNIRRRIERILVENEPLSARLSRRHIALAACLLPLAFLAGSISLHVSAAEPVTPLQSQPATATPPVPAPPLTLPAPPDVPVPPHRLNSSHTSSYSYHTGDHPYAIVSGDSVTMSGASNDLSEARHLKSSEKGDYIWFVQDGKSYVIDDPQLVRESMQLFKPQEELGRQQALLGEEQAKLGEEQSRLGEMQSKVSVRSPEMERDLEKLLADLKKMKAASRQINEEEFNKLQSQLGDLQAKLGEAQALAGEEQGNLGEKQSKLGEQQGKLGEQQGKLGEEQGRMAEAADRKMRKILNDALRSGKARLVH